MREILGSGRRFTWPLGLLKSLGWKKPAGARECAAQREAALVCVREWHWPVLPGVGHMGPVAAPGAPASRPRLAGLRTERRTEARRGPAQYACACPRPDCPVPGAHPHDPGLLAATTDPRMVESWWGRRPDAPVVLATGGPVSAVSLPADAGERAVRALEDLGVRLGPVLATPTRVVLLVAPYSLEELGDLLCRQEWVPSSLRYHGRGGYVVLPPSRTGDGGVCWLREPRPGLRGTPYLPDIAVVVDMLVAAGVGAPDGSRLAF
jgi:hypothetical protein